MTDERAFFQMIAAEPANDGVRLVYADWLEEQGAADQAAFLRLEAKLAQTPVTDRDFFPLNREFRALHARVDPLWLAKLDRTDIENCFIQFEVPCPKRWERLEPTDTDTVRFCEKCGKNVYHCSTVAEARAQALEDRCVAVDSRLAREPGDLYHPRAEETALVGSIVWSDRPDRFVTLGLPARLGPLPLPLPPARRRRWWQFWK
jgi:uncharacterized protein (TIGR02996 family)